MTWSTLFDTTCKVGGIGIAVDLHTETDHWLAIDADECHICGYPEPSVLWGVGMMQIVAYARDDPNHAAITNERCINVCPRCLKSIIRGDFDGERRRQLVAKHKTIEEFIHDAVLAEEAWEKAYYKVYDRVEEASHYTYLGVSVIHPSSGPFDNEIHPYWWARDFMAALLYEELVSETEYLGYAKHMLTPSFNNPNSRVEAKGGPWKIAFDTLARPGIPRRSVGIAILRHDEGEIKIMAYTSDDAGYTYIKRVLDLQSDMIHAATCDAFEALEQEKRDAVLGLAEGVRRYIIKHPCCTIDNMVRDNPGWQKQCVREHISTLVRCELIQPDIIEEEVVWYSVHDYSGDEV
jgi:hypothetical protein